MIGQGRPRPEKKTGQSRRGHNGKTSQAEDLEICYFVAPNLGFVPDQIEKRFGQRDQKS